MDDIPLPLRTAELDSDDHFGGCPVCASGCVCGEADGRMTDEYRAFAEWSDWDPAAARLYRLATRPQH